MNKQYRETWENTRKVYCAVSERRYDCRLCWHFRRFEPQPSMRDSRRRRSRIVQDARLREIILVEHCFNSFKQSYLRMTLILETIFFNRGSDICRNRRVIEKSADSLIDTNSKNDSLRILISALTYRQERSSLCFGRSNKLKKNET